MKKEDIISDAAALKYNFIPLNVKIRFKWTNS